MLYCHYCEIDSKIHASEFLDLKLIPAISFLDEVIYELRNVCQNDDSVLMTLAENLGTISNNFDYILIDTSPFKSYLTYAAVCASDVVYTPIEADNFSYEGLRDILNTIEYINKTYNMNVDFGGVFITKADTRTTRFKQITEGYMEMLGEKFINTPIRRYEAIGQASTQFAPLLEWDRRCHAIDDYISFCTCQNLIDKKHMNKLKKYLKGGK